MSDWIIEGLPWAMKIVDDTLVWASDLSTLEQRVEEVLERCKQIKITISMKKFQIAEELIFAGYIFGNNGIKPDPEKVECIQNFPRPESVTNIRSFLGMANQLAFLLLHYFHMSVQMRKLTGKGVHWQWLPEHEEEFTKLKNVLSGKLVVQPYDPDVPVTVLTDASRPFGLGSVSYTHLTLPTIYSV